MYSSLFCPYGARLLGFTIVCFSEISEHYYHCLCVGTLLCSLFPYSLGGVVISFDDVMHQIPQLPKTCFSSFLCPIPNSQFNSFLFLVRILLEVWVKF
jgi:hypothetical protein